MKNKVIGKGAIIFWLWTDKQIENHLLIKMEFDDIKNHNMCGVIAGIRSTRYDLMDEKVTEAVSYASSLAKKENLLFWFFLDPRFASRSLIDSTDDSVDNLITTTKRGTHFDGTNPSISKIENGKFDIHVEWLLDRHSHMFIDVCLHYEPICLEKAFLYKLRDNRVEVKSIKDITDSCRFFVNYNENYVEVFGEPGIKYDEWCVVAFPRFKTNIQDYASPKNQNEFNKIIKSYKNNNINLDLIAWDEPGYYSEFGRFPVSKYIYTGFAEKYGYNLKDYLYAILLDTDNNSHIKIRNDYYSLIEDFVFGSQKKFWDYSKKFYPEIESGIHQTWHGESGGTEDMVHGSFDIWKGLFSVSGGFTDEGGGERLVDIKEESYAHYIANMVIGKSLAKFSKTKIAYYNLWGVDYDGSNPKYIPEVMDYWVDLMGVFSNKWLAHAYGYTGVIGSDRGFGPGYPIHVTWDKFNDLNKKIDDIESITDLIPSESNIALIYPVESLKAVGNLSGNYIAKKIFDLIFKLTYKGFNIDVLSPLSLINAELVHKKFMIGKYQYDYMICPYSVVLPSKVIKLIHELLNSKFPIFFDKNVPLFDESGKKIKLKCDEHFDLDKNPDLDLMQFGIKKNVYGPLNAYTTYRWVGKNLVFSLCAKEFRKYYEGDLRFSDVTIPIERSNTITIIKTTGEGKILDYRKFESY